MMKAVNKSGLWKKHLGDWVINPYVGCEHGCYHCYCPAMPGVKFNNNGQKQRDWGKYLYPKKNIVEALKAQLRTFTPEKAKRTEWGNGWVLMSFLTDCYTPSEAKYKLTRECLKLLLEAGHKVRLQTRSALVERDYDILVAHKDRVLLGTSLPYLDDELSRTLEPRATSPSRRLTFLRKARDRGIEVYVAIAPFMPFHDSRTINQVIETVIPLNPREVFCEVLNPKGDNIDMIREALVKKYPDLAQKMDGYTKKYWAKFTFKVLSHGLQQAEHFVPWPDTQRFWRSHLNESETKFLDKFLPPLETSEGIALA